MSDTITSIPVDPDTKQNLKIEGMLREGTGVVDLPRTLKREEWPPNYDAIWLWRRTMRARYETNPETVLNAKKFYAENPIAFINHWCDTHDPRNVDTNKPVWMPFILFEKQELMVRFILSCLDDEQPGLIEKSRTMGASWICVALSVWLWLYKPGVAIGWGSQDAHSVDQIGNPKSIFWKIRELIKRLPEPFLPPLSPDNLKQYVCSNPLTGSSIVGEVGDSIGRGGRTRVYFKDEAQPLDAKILTPSGWQLMADMKVGSKVIGSNGRTRKVTQVKDHGVYDIYRVTFSDGTSTECSPNHRWAVTKVWGPRQQLVLTTSQLVEDFLHTFPSGQVRYKYRVQTSAPVKFAKRTQPLPLHPYVVGALLGDGCVTQVGTYSAGLTTADPEIASRVEQLLPAGTMLRFGGGLRYFIVDELSRYRSRRVQSRATIAVLATGIVGCYSYNKFIPDAYKFASPAERLSLLQGLMDTDGSADKGVAYFGSTSQQLAEDVRFLAHSLGGVATLRARPNYQGHRTIYAVNLSLPEGLAPFSLRRKQDRYGKRSQELSRTILSIELVGRKPVRCISVDAPDGLYLTDHCIVTHNSAHYEHPEAIEASLSENTKVAIDISSVNGLGNLFHRKREAGMDWYPGAKIPRGKTRVFVMDWSDHPEYNETWFKEKKQYHEDQTTAHIFASEIERNYAASVQGTIIPKEWLDNCVDAHVKLGIPASEGKMSGLDIGDSEDGDRNAQSIRSGIVLTYAEEWYARDPGVTARKAIARCVEHNCNELQYDAAGGLGSNVKSEANRLKDEGAMPKNLHLVPWNAGGKVLHPGDRVVPADNQSPRNKDFYTNLKAQAWWHVRSVVYNTHSAITGKGKYDAESGGVKLPDGSTYDIDDLFSIDGQLPLLYKVVKELCQATASRGSKLKLLVDKAPEGTKSPNIADSIVMAYWPMPRFTHNFVDVGLGPKVFVGGEPFIL